jgi:apolipoprotein D and lipocalin family protein
MKRSFLLLVILWSVLSSSCTTLKPLSTEENVNLNKYMGNWYEIARLPNFFQNGCKNSKAKYKVLDDEYISVENSCYKNNVLVIAKAKAWKASNDSSRLKVRFFWPFTGDYWILYVSKDYQYAVVGEPSRDYLWFLSRTNKPISTEQLEIMKKVALENGYNISDLVFD